MSGRRHIIVHKSDTVSTLLDDDTAATSLEDGRPCTAGIPFGHKVALKAMSSGERIMKYGVAIGVATQTIAPGEHVHVHNCR